ncbi:DUF7130 family rubredoxin-like protein [Halovivax gelatinilyticus]|uniref:DUF7130 family rubredoxin-like protein n=1 Tax=Halovivax gelatinilyticus TaxID=2961597 RepID=UPI0020CA927B|nr:hypothetical protein [Halovivax gelatinilyticus]
MSNTSDQSATDPQGNADEDVRRVGSGQTVYDADGIPLGTVRGFDTDGFFVTTREGIESLSVEHVKSGQSWGEAELMWRCMECGEMGEIAGGLPDICPECGTEKENLMYWTED